jgi:hypothetical protein
MTVLFTLGQSYRSGRETAAFYFRLLIPRGFSIDQKRRGTQASGVKSWQLLR